MSGYHIRKINKGVLGEISKIQEEYEEVLDSIEQDSIIMELVELSDLYGAFEAYLERYGFHMKGLINTEYVGDIESVGEAISGLGTVPGNSRFYNELRVYSCHTRNVSMRDLKIMSDITKRAFTSGERV